MEARLGEGAEKAHVSRTLGKDIRKAEKAGGGLTKVPQQLVA